MIVWLSVTYVIPNIFLDFRSIFFVRVEYFSWGVCWEHGPNVVGQLLDLAFSLLLFRLASQAGWLKYQAKILAWLWCHFRMSWGDGMRVHEPCAQYCHSPTWIRHSHSDHRHTGRHRCVIVIRHCNAWRCVALEVITRKAGPSPGIRGPRTKCKVGP